MWGAPPSSAPIRTRKHNTTQKQRHPETGRTKPNAKMCFHSPPCGQNTVGVWPGARPGLWSPPKGFNLKAIPGGANSNFQNARHHCTGPRHECLWPKTLCRAGYNQGQYAGQIRVRHSALPEQLYPREPGSQAGLNHNCRIS